MAERINTRARIVAYGLKWGLFPLLWLVPGIALYELFFGNVWSNWLRLAIALYALVFSFGVAALLSAFGFAEHAALRRQYSAESFELSDAVEQSLQELGWKYELVSAGEFVARIGPSRWSLGEKVHIKITPDGVLTAESQCVSPLQLQDSRKNQRNLLEFFHHLESFLPPTSLNEPATPGRSYIDA